ncbi:MAG: NUDIX hydrolase [Firmicutes bacterium]|jgi:8-oxo-dGTP pyrophosphatase MutT (NUDIX family)|nr:NUDIX hydrolase [Bacillota bacterium]
MPSNGNEEFTLVSSGGVLYRSENGEIQVCLIAKKGMKVWALPRGRVEPGETPEETALREVKEETGFSAKILEKIDQIHFRFYSKIDDEYIHRIVHFYLMPWENEKPGKRDKEVDTARWYPIDKAIQMLKYENEKEILKKAKKSLKTRIDTDVIS